MAERPVRVAVIGTSFAAAVQIPGFQQCPGVEVVAVASGHEERARQTAERFGIPRGYADWRQMIDEVDCDLVSVVTPPYLHHEMTIAALGRGRHVLCEKPFASNVVQAHEMLSCAERAGVVHAVDHEFRYRPARRLFKELVDAGYLGETWVVRWGHLTGRLAEPDSRPWDWWSERDKDGGWFGAIGSHMIDSLLWWFGDVVELAAQINTFVKQRPLPDRSAWREVTADDDAALLFRFASGARGSLDLSGVTRHGSSRLEAFGSEGTLVVDEDERVFAARGAGSLEAVPIPDRLVRRVAGDPRLAPFVELAERVIARVRGQDAGDFADFEQGVRVQALMDAAHQSVAERRIVEVRTLG